MTTKQPLTTDERTALYAELHPDNAVCVDAIIKALLDEQNNPRPDVEPMPVAPKPPAEPAPAIYEDTLDYFEVTAVHIMSQIIRGRYLGRSELMDGGFQALFNRIHEALLDMAGQWDMVEVERICEELRR